MARERATGNPATDSPPPRRPSEEESLRWSPIAAAVVILIPGAIGLASGQLLLFPSLGPTAVMQAHSPRHRSSRFYNVVVSHLVAGYAVVALFGIAHSPSVFEMTTLTAPRVGAAAVALVLATTAELALKASHPPAASTTLLVALGSFNAGVLFVAVAGEIVRRARLEWRLGA